MRWLVWVAVAVGLLFDDGDKAVDARLAVCKQQVSELIARDKNHPSVILSSVDRQPKMARALPALALGREPVDPAAE